MRRQPIAPWRAWMHTACVPLLALALPAEAGPRTRTANTATSYIVQLSGTHSPAAVEPLATAVGATYDARLEVVNGFCARMTPAQAAALAHDPRVAGVSRDARVCAANAVTGATVGAYAAQHAFAELNHARLAAEVPLPGRPPQATPTRAPAAASRKARDAPMIPAPATTTSNVSGVNG